MKTSRSLPIATTLFFLSGALGLGYELVWIRKAALVVGASQIALSTVLTSFFLGIALGSYFVGTRLRAKRYSPLFVYGLFEVAIGVFALAFPWLFELLELLYGSLYPSVQGSALLLFATRFLLLFVLILPPTFFMGGTLPLLLDGLVAEDRNVGSRTSFLYGVNILGAVLGVLATCYWALPWLGMNGTSQAGGVGNIAIGVFAMAYFSRLPRLHEAPAERPRLGAFFPLAAFASGLIAIGYQIAWARYFTLFNTMTVYITAILLAVYLLALAGGSFLLAPMLRVGLRPLRVLAAVQAFVPLAVIGCLTLWRTADYRVALRGVKLPQGGGDLSATREIDVGYREFFTFVSESLDATFFAPLLQISLVLFLPVLLLGMGLPSLIAGATVRSEDLRGVAGRLVFWNTVGASAGGFFAGYALIPLLGLHGSLALLGLGSLALAFAAVWKGGERTAAPPEEQTRQERKRQQGAAPSFRWYLGWELLAIGVSAVVLGWFAFAREDITRETVRDWGYGRDSGAVRSGLQLARIHEGPLATSFVFDGPESTQIGSGHVSLAVLYKNEPSTQAIQGHVPVLLYPGEEMPEDCLGICLGTGQSFGALLLYPEIEKLDVVDISPGIIELSLETYQDVNHGLGTDHRVEPHLDDGRHFVDRAPDDAYDIISMEPPPPTADGVASLYSKEFYDSVHRILRPGGVFMQWLPLYRVTPLDAVGIVKTQAAVFPQTFVVKVGRDDFMVLSYPETPKFSIEAMRERLEVFRKERLIAGRKWHPACQFEIASVGGVLSTLVLAPEDISRLEGPETYHDETQLLSYSSGDRELLRLYRGPALSLMSFRALGLSQIRAFAQFFHPPLERAEHAALSRDRAISLTFFDPYSHPAPLAERAPLQSAERQAKIEFIQGLDFLALDRKLAQFEGVQDRAAKQGLAFSIARAFDGQLDKRRAFEWVRRAIAIDPSVGHEACKRLVSLIARNHIVPYQDIVREEIAKTAQAFPSSPIVAVLRGVLAQFNEEDRKRKATYWAPDPLP